MIYKNKGSVSDPKNYRPISLLSRVGLLFEAIVERRMSKYAEAHETDGSVLPEPQALGIVVGIGTLLAHEYSDTHTERSTAARRNGW